MKKMKRFLSLLICMVMLMSVLPMGASAAHVHDWRGEFTFINDDPSGHYYDCNYCDYTTEKEDHWFYVGEWYGTYYDGSECFTCHYKKPQTYNITYMDGTTKTINVCHEVASDGASELLQDLVNSLDEDSYRQYLRYHFYICEKPEFLGMSNHLLFVGTK